jgi:hypothetical protein
VKLTIELDVDVVVRQTSKGFPASPPCYSHGGLPAEPPEYEIESVILGNKDIKDQLSQATLDYIAECILNDHDIPDIPFG